MLGGLRCAMRCVVAMKVPRSSARRYDPGLRFIETQFIMTKDNKNKVPKSVYWTTLPAQEGVDAPQQRLCVKQEISGAIAEKLNLGHQLLNILALLARGLGVPRV